jgi:uncharacterized membrane protein HdeD (DUF308 family)
MLASLAASWGLVLFRGSLAVLLAVFALLWPGLTRPALITLVAAYALADGIAALIVALGARGHPGFGSLLLESLGRVGAGVTVLAYSGATVSALALFGAWAVWTGGAELVAAVALRREVTGAWPLPTAGTASVLLGLVLLWRSELDLRPFAWLIAVYGVVFGMLLLTLAVRLRQLSLEIATARARRAAGIDERVSIEH